MIYDEIIDNKLIPSMLINESYKTLGTQMDIFGKCNKTYIDTKTKLCKILETLSICKLHNWMKLKLFNEFAFSKFEFCFCCKQ